MSVWSTWQRRLSCIQLADQSLPQPPHCQKMDRGIQPEHRRGIQPTGPGIRPQGKRIHGQVAGNTNPVLHTVAQSEAAASRPGQRFRPQPSSHTFRRICDDLYNPGNGTITQLPNPACSYDHETDETIAAPCFCFLHCFNDLMRFPDYNYLNACT